MKINDTQASDPTEDAQDVDSSQQDDDKNQDEPSAFSRALAKKQAAQEEGLSPKTAKKTEEPSDTRLGPFSAQEAFSQVAETKQVESKHVVELPPQLQQLVREIAVVAGKNQVQIEMNSNVLKGLNIQIERQNGALAIQFQTSSPEVTKLLSNNLDSLSQGLADRGLNIADIRVTTSKATSSFGSKDRSGATQARYQGGRR